MMQHFRWQPFAVALLILPMVGCSQPVTRLTATKPTAAAYVTATEFEQLLQSSNDLVVVEFGVETGCARCDELRPQVEWLADRLAGQAKVRRLNLNVERKLASRLGVTACPTYIAFVNGQEAFRTSYPTSGELIAAQLDDSLHATQIRDTP